MTLDVDKVIFVSFLVLNLFLGLVSSRGVRSITSYAIGDRNFSTATIVSTIVATWISGEYFFTIASEAYNNGLYFIWGATVSDLVCFLLISIVFAPRMAEFLGKLSIAEAMGGLYGEKVRIITAISGFIGITGIISVQLKAAGIVFEYSLGVPSDFGSIIAGIIITVYSSLGGIKSVTFTDFIQFVTFGIVVPVIVYYLLKSIHNVDEITSILGSNPSFDYKNVFDFTQTKSLYFLFLFLFSAIPGFSPAMFQRISMSKNTKQVSKSFTIAAFTCFMLGVSICWIGVLTIALHPDIDPNDVVKMVVTDSSSVTGLKGLILVGIMAMIMSTVDSYINSTSVLIAHDFLKPLKIVLFNKELFSARVISFLIGIFSIGLSLRDNSLLNLLILSYSFYMPVVSVPFMMAILGFRSTERSVILGMGAGLITVIIWNYFDIKVVDSVIPAMFANFFTLITSHYLLKQKGGWVGIKDNLPLIRTKLDRKAKLQKLWFYISSLNFSILFEKNSPKNESLISIVGLFVMISTFSSVSTLPDMAKLLYANILDVFYPITLCFSTILISYPLWLSNWKETEFVELFWNLGTFVVLICFSFFLVFISNFHEIQLIAFMVNIMIISSLSKWQWVLFNVIFGVSTVGFICKTFLITNEIANELLSDDSETISEFKIVYLLLFISSSLILFIKPKQTHQELMKEKLNTLKKEILNKEVELQQIIQTKHEFMYNLESEMYTPLITIVSLNQTLEKAYDKITEIERKKIIAEISENTKKIKILTNNVIALYKLANVPHNLNKRAVDLTKLVMYSLGYCKKNYLNKKNIEFITHVENNIMVLCDERYIRLVVDTLIINAIKYSNQGKITIYLKRSGHSIEFKIIDEGIIASEELSTIFDAFVTNSRTNSLFDQQNVAFALCKKVIELHYGTISANSNKTEGVIFTFTLPGGI